MDGRTASSNPVLRSGDQGGPRLVTGRVPMRYRMIECAMGSVIGHHAAFLFGAAKIDDFARYIAWFKLTPLSRLSKPEQVSGGGWPAGRVIRVGATCLTCLTFEGSNLSGDLCARAIPALKFGARAQPTRDFRPTKVRQGAQRWRTQATRVTLRTAFSGAPPVSSCVLPNCRDCVAASR